MKTFRPARPITQVIVDAEQERAGWEYSLILVSTAVTQIAENTYVAFTTYARPDRADFWVDASLYQTLPSFITVRVRRIGEIPFDFDPNETI